MTLLPSDKRALAEALLARRSQKRSRFDAGQKAAIFGKYLAGEKADDIGAKFGVSGATITKLVNDAIVEGLGPEAALKRPRKKKGKI